MILLFIVIVVLADFAWENRTNLPSQDLKLFTFTLGQLPTFLLVYIGVAVGWLVGWFGHMWRLRKKRRRAAAALVQEQQSQAQQGQGTSQ